jgi:hypothetical protein
MAPCGWTVEGCGCGGAAWDTYPQDVQDRAQALAATIMWAATGRRYGVCEVTVMPAGQCSRLPGPEDGYRTYPVGTPAGMGLLAPVIVQGQWYNRPGGGLCCTATGCEVVLQGPTTTGGIKAVSVDGEPVAADAYVVQNGDLLVRVDGECWPCCTKYTDPATAFTVTYDLGVPIPAALQAAFEELACELAKSCTGAACALPRTITRLSRQGVDVEVAELPVDTSGLVLTGLRTVDDVIRSLNPHQLVSAPLVLSPDTPQPRWSTP